ncbi:hypothetical protein VBM87_00690 [Mycoplasma sp. 744]|uniref:MG284/MPN403 family protein n=1 Tax=unclassified Mycoplasma TaxID=2683645 RepID=UPI00211D1340|nr:MULTISPECIES: hypothetical protein [unclassified Mycoplasma]MEA4115302.1 hypothetical protein [Mycoplasma sp. 744]UUM19304.1 hypothetical protein NPA14_00290 [Mycoplasma sp. 1018B]
MAYKIKTFSFLSNIPSKEKYKIVQNICNIERANKEWYLLKSKTDNIYKNILLQPENKLDKVMNCLENTSKLIIEKDFINKYTQKEWYEDYFCKTVYYKHKNEAVEEFLYYYLNN